MEDVELLNDQEVEALIQEMIDIESGSSRFIVQANKSLICSQPIEN